MKKLQRAHLIEQILKEVVGGEKKAELSEVLKTHFF